VEKYKAGLRENPPKLAQPTPHQLLDILECLEKLEKGYP